MNSGHHPYGNRGKSNSAAVGFSSTHPADALMSKKAPFSHLTSPGLKKGFDAGHSFPDPYNYERALEPSGNAVSKNQ